MAGGKAQWAGDEAMTSKTRSFGLVYPTTGFDLADFEARLKQNGGATIKEAVGYDPNDASAADQMPTLVTKLKSSGVTSVVLFANNALTAPLLKAATAQEFSPEWVFTGYSYQDFDVFARAYDQEQMKHAFGLSVLFPSISNLPDYLDVYNWYWGKTQGQLLGHRVGPVQLHVHGDPVRRTDAHRREREEGLLLGAGHGRCRDRDGGVPVRVRQDRGHAVRRVLPARHRPRVRLLER